MVMGVEASLGRLHAHNSSSIAFRRLQTHQCRHELPLPQ